MGVRSTGSQHPTTTEADGHLLEYFRQNFGGGGGGTNTSPIPLGGMQATGGVISDYTEPGGGVFRAHVFTSSGVFEITQGGDFGDTVNYLLVGGGGGGGASNGGGGGAGRVLHRENIATPGSFPAPFAVVVGGGGGGQRTGDHNRTLYPGSATTLALGSVSAPGGGAGGTGFDPGPKNPGENGGAGGGGGTNEGTGGSGSGSLWPGSGSTISPTNGWGGSGGSGGPTSSGGGGGGGAEDNGFNYDHPTVPSSGGAGIIIPGPVMSGSELKLAGGGGGGRPSGAVNKSSATDRGGAGVRNGSSPAPGNHGTFSTGGGGGGGGGYPASNGGSGGSGIAVIRYQIGTTDTSDARATGGAISFYGGKTIHTFTASGTFTTEPNWSNVNVEYVVIGGGGAGGGNAGGGGGAGAYKKGTTPVSGTGTAVTVQVGGGGAKRDAGTSGRNGTSSYFGTPITSPGGGHGGHSNANGGNGGSAGGGNNSGSSDGDNFPGNLADSVPGNGWGHNGGVQSGSGASRCQGGGGGAGGTGGNAASPNTGGDGGAGIQLPSTFRNPDFVSPGNRGFGGAGPTGAPTPNGFDTSGNFWFAGGGGGSSHYPGPDPGGAGGGGPNTATPYAGAGAGGVGGYPNCPADGFGKDALQNTGSGGGAGSGGCPTLQHGGGGSGIVLIAYPT